MSERVGVIVGISGASGAAIGVRVVERLADNPRCAVHLVISTAAERTLAAEVGAEAQAHLRRLAFRCHAHDDVGASIASGSFPVRGMIVAPCSIRTLSGIAWGQLDNLLVRAADVQLKERRRLVLLVRESPLHLGHLRAMTRVTEIGAIGAPAAAGVLSQDDAARRGDRPDRLPRHQSSGPARCNSAGAGVDGRAGARLRLTAPPSRRARRGPRCRARCP